MFYKNKELLMRLGILAGVLRPDDIFRFILQTLETLLVLFVTNTVFVEKS